MGLPSHRKPTAPLALTTLVLVVHMGLLGCGTPSLPPQPEDKNPPVSGLHGCELTEAGAAAAWSRYRHHRPFHAQEVAVSEPDAKGCRTIILSEPPPGTTKDSFQAVHPSLANLVARQHPVGVDGFTEDFVGALPAMSDEELAEVSSRLHMVLFGTAYRARLAPVGAPSPWKGPLDVEVRPAELHQWVLGADATFWPVDGGPRERANDLFDPSQTGVYVSATPGLVLWSFPKKGNFAEQRANVRIFGVESDLVLGAMADDDTVVVIGRERVAPVDVLPPLRFESVQILATTSLHQLAQSYERTQVFAGTLSNGKDWAPILLSPAIVDTEIGSVLNIADQLLKRWSMAKKVDYERFAYPDEPADGPFAAPISEVLEADVVTFNWNTARTGALTPLSDGKALYWMHRTGALNVSYIPADRPDSRTASYEDKARDFFARQADVHLVRAVQHAALFQAFRQLGVSSEDEITGFEDTIGPDAAMDTLLVSAEETIRKLGILDDAALTAAATSFADRELGGIEIPTEAEIQKLLARVPREERARLEPQLRAKITELWGDLAKKVKSDQAREIVRTAKALRKSIAAPGAPDAARKVAVFLVYEPLARHSAQSPSTWSTLLARLKREDARRRAREVGEAGAFMKAHRLDQLPRDQWRDVLAALSDLDQVQATFSKARNNRTTSTHVRTPSVVRSQARLVGAQGGHNVGSSVPRVAAPLRLADLGRVSVNRSGLFLRPMPLPARARSEALLSVPSRVAPAKISLGGPPPPRVPDAGWARLSDEPSFGCGARCVAIRRYASTEPQSGGLKALRPRFQFDLDGTVSRAGSTLDITDQVVRSLSRKARRGKPKDLNLTFAINDKNMTADEAMAMSTSIRGALAREHLDVELGFIVDRQDGAALRESFDLTGATVSEPRREASSYVISVMVPRKTGLRMRLFTRSAPPADGSWALPNGTRTPQDLARELRSQLDPDLVLELAGDAQSVNTENETGTPRGHHAGATGSTL